MKGLRYVAAVGLCAPVIAAVAQDYEPTSGGKVYTFKQTSQGACVMQSGTLIFDSYGNGTLKLATMTTEGDDIWRARVRLRNVAGTEVFTSPELNSPKMENADGHPQTYSWSYSFKINPTLLPSATTAEMIDIRC
jgi:hypothetical protein